MIKNLFLFFFFFITSSFVYSQCDKVLLMGKVEDTVGFQNFYNLMVVNKTTGKGVFGNPDGSFSVFVKDKDLIALSVRGYLPITFIVEGNNDCQFKVHKYLELKTEELQTVVITPLKTLEQIKQERQGLVMRETREVTGMQVLQSPITALYQTFSKKEQNKRWIAEQEFKDDQRKVVQELLRLYVAYDIVNLNDEEFDDFISFLNINSDFLQTATEMELITFVKDKFIHYKMINKRKFIYLENWRTSFMYSQDPIKKIEALFVMLEEKGVLVIPKEEYERFIRFLNLKPTFVEQVTDEELVTKIVERYIQYEHFYKLK
jgi:hypothetical protein